jgi:hypothetical protein
LASALLADGGGVKSGIEPLPCFNRDVKRVIVTPGLFTHFG